MLQLIALPISRVTKIFTIFSGFDIVVCPKDRNKWSKKIKRPIVVGKWLSEWYVWMWWFGL